MGRLGRILSASWACLEPFWERFGASWGVLGASRQRLGASWSVLEPSWGVLEASWERLGVVLGRLGSILARQTFQDMIFKSIFHGFGFRSEPWELQKSLIFLGFLHVFCVSVVFNIKDDLGWILLSTWLHFGAV